MDPKLNFVKSYFFVKGPYYLRAYACVCVTLYAYIIFNYSNI